MSNSLAAVVGGAAGAIALVVILIGFIWLCMQQCKKFANRNSDTGSSDPSALVEWNKGGASSSAAGPSLSGPQGARQFTLEELQQATSHFSESNLIGHGSFGLVYMGLLRDGTVVAVKRRSGTPRQQFVEEVRRLSEIQHRNLVTLLGYCQEEGLQMLVFENLPNGSICSHLYVTRQDSTSQLEFKQRLSIALGAAKGLCHLHGLSPPLAHKHFKTSNVLVDENFIAKVADAGISRLLQRIEEAGPSSQMMIDVVFRDPEIGEYGTPTETSDVYSFGVFLLELITGQESRHLDLLQSGGSLTQWRIGVHVARANSSHPRVPKKAKYYQVELHSGSNDLVDRRLGNTFTADGIQELIKLTLWCLNLSGKSRPKMEIVVSELNRILEKEMALTTGIGEGTATFTLGSWLFTSA